MSTITNNNGTSNTVYVGEGFLDNREYRHDNGSNWEEVIYSGGYGGTGRGSTIIERDAPTGQGDKWGSPHTAQAHFVFCDGSVRGVTFRAGNESTANPFYCALRWNNNVTFTLN